MMILLHVVGTSAPPGTSSHYMKVAPDFVDGDHTAEVGNWDHKLSQSSSYR